MSKLFVVATPIGNLDDISTRTLNTLEVSDLILAEDTRVTQKILNTFNIDTPIKRYNEHKPNLIFNELVELFNEDKNVVLVSDSGTPGISDPGGKLVRFVRENFEDVEIRVVPGPSAVTSILSVSGLPSNEFAFLGFPPLKNKRKKFFERIKDLDIRPVIIYESPHRLLKTLEEIKLYIGSEIDVFIGREMTKIYEEYFEGSISEAIDYFGDNGDGKIKGEFVIIIK
jgi:16S rRNA (cytidine1402-2'-O)-methyltransferase